MNNLRSFSRIIVMITFIFLAYSCEKDENPAIINQQANAVMMKADAHACEMVTDLMAGQHMDVGDVRVVNDGVNIYVTYEILEPGWGMTQSHLHIADALQGIPMNKKGNPKIGLFEYQNEHAMIQKYTYVVPLTWDTGTELFIAAHAVVRYDYLLSAAGSLPDDADLYPKYPYHASYFQSIVSNGEIINGIYEGWCIDAGHGIAPNNTWDVNVYSSYENLANLGNVDHPEELDKVNWLLNQDFVGKMSGCGSGSYTKNDVQQTIWMLVDDTYLQIGDPCRVSEIYELALKYGEGFVPACSQNIAVILEPWNGMQVTIMEIPMAALTGGCDQGSGEETAWAAGLPFPGNSWAMYFNYTVCE